MLVTEEEARRAIHDLQRLDVDAGPCGAATLAGARRLTADAQHLTVDESSVVVLLNTESLSANPVGDAA